MSSIFHAQAVEGDPYLELLASSELTPEKVAGTCFDGGMDSDEDLMLRLALASTLETFKPTCTDPYQIFRGELTSPEQAKGGTSDGEAHSNQLGEYVFHSAKFLSVTPFNELLSMWPGTSVRI